MIKLNCSRLRNGFRFWWAINVAGHDCQNRWRHSSRKVIVYFRSVKSRPVQLETVSHTIFVRSLKSAQTFQIQFSFILCFNRNQYEQSVTKLLLEKCPAFVSRFWIFTRESFRKHRTASYQERRRMLWDKSFGFSLVSIQQETQIQAN